jgi:hypothetical protein
MIVLPETRSGAPGLKLPSAPRMVWQSAYVDIAYRTGRSIEDWEKNPFYGRAHTVSDLVMFFVNQPRQSPA